MKFVRIPRVGDFVAYTDRGRRRIGRVDAVERMGVKLVWVTPRYHGTWEQNLQVQIPTDALVRVVDPLDPPARARTPLEMYHDAVDHYGKFIGRTARVRDALREIVARGLTFKNTPSK